MRAFGEALRGESTSIYDKSIIDNICQEIGKVKEAGYQIEIVVGAGNLLRGRDFREWGIDRNSMCCFFITVR